MHYGLPHLLHNDWWVSLCLLGCAFVLWLTVITMVLIMEKIRFTLSLRGLSELSHHAIAGIRERFGRPMGKNPLTGEYDFTLELCGLTELSLELENALVESACDDGTLCKRGGEVSITFSRKSDSFNDAVMSAARDIKKVLPDVRLRVIWPYREDSE